MFFIFVKLIKIIVWHTFCSRFSFFNYNHFHYSQILYFGSFTTLQLYAL
nr:MAG TPA: hypothetical protein [Crassvirales sp.]